MLKTNVISLYVKRIDGPTSSKVSKVSIEGPVLFIISFIFLYTSVHTNYNLQKSKNK